jgi:hypothetical protein
MAMDESESGTAAIQARMNELEALRQNYSSALDWYQEHGEEFMQLQKQRDDLGGLPVGENLNEEVLCDGCGDEVPNNYATQGFCLRCQGHEDGLHDIWDEMSYEERYTTLFNSGITSTYAEECSQLSWDELDGSTKDALRRFRYNKPIHNDPLGDFLQTEGRIRMPSREEEYERWWNLATQDTDLVQSIWTDAGIVSRHTGDDEAIEEFDLYDIHDVQFHTWASLPEHLKRYLRPRLRRYLRKTGEGSLQDLHHRGGGRKPPGSHNIPRHSGSRRDDGGDELGKFLSMENYFDEAEYWTTMSYKGESKMTTVADFWDLGLDLDDDRHEGIWDKAWQEAIDAGDEEADEAFDRMVDNYEFLDSTYYNWGELHPRIREYLTTTINNWTGGGSATTSPAPASALDDLGQWLSTENLNEMSPVEHWTTMSYKDRVGFLLRLGFTQTQAETWAVVVSISDFPLELQDKIQGGNHRQTNRGNFPTESELRAEAMVLCEGCLDYKEVVSQRHFKETGYVYKRVIVADTEYGGDGKLEMEIAESPEGLYIGRPSEARHLCKKFGIRQFEKADPEHSIASIGFNPSKQKWYGWSHRAVAGFGIGDRIFDEKYGDDNTLFVKHGREPIKNLDDAKLAAIRFAASVS